jgi:hypothetical protein
LYFELSDHERCQNSIRERQATCKTQVQDSSIEGQNILATDTLTEGDGFLLFCRGKGEQESWTNFISADTSNPSYQKASQSL